MSRYTVTSTSNISTVTLAATRRLNGAINEWEAAVAEAREYAIKKGPPGMRVVGGPDGKGEYSYGFSFVGNGEVRHWRTIRIEGIREGTPPDDLEDALAASLVALRAGSL